MSSGKIVQIIGAVLDVEFPSESIPNVYDALIVEGEGINTTLEVQQQLGDGVVRTIALGSTDGLQRGLSVRNTGEAISIPVGTKTPGRIMNVLGEAIDEIGPINMGVSEEYEKWIILLNQLLYFVYHHSLDYPIFDHQENEVSNWNIPFF